MHASYWGERRKAKALHGRVTYDLITNCDQTHLHTQGPRIPGAAQGVQLHTLEILRVCNHLFLQTLISLRGPMQAAEGDYRLLTVSGRCSRAPVSLRIPGTLMPTQLSPKGSMPVSKGHRQTPALVGPRTMTEGPGRGEKAQGAPRVSSRCLRAHSGT